MQQIRAAADERDFYAIRSLHFEKLSGRRQDQYSMRLNDQYRLILEIAGRAADKVIVIVGIEDYHLIVEKETPWKTGCPQKCFRPATS